MCMMAYLTPSWNSGKIRKDNKILTENLESEEIEDAKNVLKGFAVRQWFRNGL